MIGVPTPFRPGRLDQTPSVHPGEHQVDDADIGRLEAQTAEARVAVRDDLRVEVRQREVVRHGLGDDVVVFDDQDLRHTDDDYAAAD